MNNPTHIYRVEITAYPAEACALIKDYGDGAAGEVPITPPVDGMVGLLTDDWEPDDWDSADGGFYWPSTNRVYRSRSAAKARARLIESYGATTRILVSPVVWEDLDEYTRQQRLMRARVRADKLRRQADEIERAAA